MGVSMDEASGIFTTIRNLSHECKQSPYCNTCRSRRWRAQNNEIRNARDRKRYHETKQLQPPDICAKCGRFGKVQRHHTRWRSCTDCNKSAANKPAKCKEHIALLCAECHAVAHQIPKRRANLSYDWRQRQDDMLNRAHLESI